VHDDDVARLRLSVTRLARLLRQQDRAGLTPTLTATLATIAREGPLTLGELATQEQVAPPTVTKLVARLEAAGLIERRTDPHDGRVRTVQLTTSGRRQLDSIRRRRNAWLQARVESLSDAERDALVAAVDVLDRLVAVPV
jgi:DNA-binding MarR family transcriptional regulator